MQRDSNAYPENEQPSGGVWVGDASTLRIEARQLTMWFNRPFTANCLLIKMRCGWLDQEHSIRRLRRLSERPDTKFFELVQLAKIEPSLNA